MSAAFGAVDIGNSGLRVMLGRLTNGQLAVDEISRIPNAPYLSPEGWRWNVAALHAGMIQGLAHADEIEPLASIGIDTWGVDCALIGPGGSLLDDPFSYRDERSVPMVELARSRISSDKLYALTGCQEMPINTLYQLLADEQSGRLDHADKFMMISDLCAWWLTGQVGADETNASTTGLFDPVERTWSWEAIDAIGLRRLLFAPVQRTGTVLGRTTSESGVRTEIPVVTVGGHDTAVAFVVGADRPDSLVISLGTWSLVGVELDAPLITEAGRLANFTNEIGVLGTIRFLKNAAGMWILQECMREWRAEQPDLNWDRLLAAASNAAPFGSLFDPDDARFMSPGAMAGRVAAAGDGDLGSDRGAIVRSILESLSFNHRYLLEVVQQVIDRELTSIRIVGGGSRNNLLCQMTADAIGLPVIAGPVEATAIGNLAMQAIALGELPDLADAREVIGRSFPQTTYVPGDRFGWDEAYRRWLNLLNR